MRFTLTASLALALVASVTASPAVAGHRRQECRFGRSDRAVRRTIRCAVDRYHVPGGRRHALAIARRESGFECGADNPTSTAGGVYQVLIGTWKGWHRRLHPWWRRWGLARSRYNCRANVMASIRVAHASGWIPTWRLTA